MEILVLILNWWKSRVPFEIFHVPQVGNQPLFYKVGFRTFLFFRSVVRRSIPTFRYFSERNFWSKKWRRHRRSEMFWQNGDRRFWLYFVPGGLRKRGGERAKSGKGIELPLRWRVWAKKYFERWWKRDWKRRKNKQRKQLAIQFYKVGCRYLVPWKPLNNFTLGPQIFYHVTTWEQ